MLSRPCALARGGALLAFLSSFGQTFFLAVFSDIRTAFGLSHGGWGTVYMIGTGLSAALMISAGRLADRS